MTTVYKFKAYYTDSGVGTVQDPAPTCTVINMADDSKLADAQATTASTNMPGLYSYEYSGADGLDCVAWFKTTDTGCDVKELASYVSEKITTNLNADVASVETKLDTVDTNVDSILADTGTDGVKIADTQGAITWGQQKIVANVASQGALNIQNSSTTGYGILSKGYMGAWLEGNINSTGGYGLFIRGNGGVSIYGKNPTYGGMVIYNGNTTTLELCTNYDSIKAKNRVRGFDPEIVNQIQESLTEAVEPLASIPDDIAVALEPLAALEPQPKAMQLPPEEGE